MWIPAAHPFFLMSAIRRPFVGALLRFARGDADASALASAVERVVDGIPLLRARVRWKGPWVGYDVGTHAGRELVERRTVDAPQVSLDEAARALPTSTDRLFVAVVFEAHDEIALVVGASSSVCDARALFQVIEAIGEALGGASTPRAFDARHWSLRRLLKGSGAPSPGDQTPPERTPRSSPPETAFVARTATLGSARAWHAPAFLGAALRAAASPRPIRVLWATDGRFATAERSATDRTVRLANVSDIRTHTFAPSEVRADDTALLRTCGRFVEEALRDPVVGDGWAGRFSLVPSRVVERQATFLQSSVMKDTMYASWGGDVGAVFAAFPRRPRAFVALANSPPHADLPGAFATMGDGEATISVCYDPSRLPTADAEAFTDRLVEALVALAPARP